MSNNIRTNTTGRLTSCLQKKIDKTILQREVSDKETEFDVPLYVLTKKCGKMFMLYCTKKVLQEYEY